MYGEKKERKKNNMYKFYSRPFIAVVRSERSQLLLGIARGSLLSSSLT